MNTQNLVQGMMEKAGLSVEVSGSTPTLFDAIVDELTRANKLLDSNRSAVMFSLLNLSKIEDVIRATQSYTRSFLLSQKLSLASVQEVCGALIALAKSYKVSPPTCWVDIYEGNFGLAEIDPDLEDDNIPEERSRVDI